MLKTHLRISCEYSLRLALVGLFYFFCFLFKKYIIFADRKRKEVIQRC